MSLSVVTGILSLLTALVGATVWYWRAKASTDAARADKAEAALNDIRIANEARLEARAASARVPQSEPLPDDGFRRD